MAAGTITPRRAKAQAARDVPLPATPILPVDPGPDDPVQARQRQYQRGQHDGGMLQQERERRPEPHGDQSCRRRPLEVTPGQEGPNNDPLDPQDVDAGIGT